MTYNEIKELREILDRNDIDYNFGNFYDFENPERIIGHWLNIPETEFETNELDEEDRLCNGE